MAPTGCECCGRGAAERPAGSVNGIRTALALSFILLVSSELIVAREGLGYLIGFLGANGSYDAMYAVVLTVAFLGFAADRGYQMLMNRMLQWREQTP
jgi:ABC-type nitrate/sulfonate/bicarbonate transport system permease component